MSRGVRGTGTRWDVKGVDVPGGRAIRSIVKGLSRETPKAKEAELAQRRTALDGLRRIAGQVAHPADRDALWALVPRIALVGYPSWEEVVAADTEAALLQLAWRSEIHAETGARHDRDAQVSALRTCRHSVDEYLGWQEQEGFAPDTQVTAASTLRGLLSLCDSNERSMAHRLVASLTAADGELCLDHLAKSRKGKGRNAASTRGKTRKILKAWFNWELEKELERATAEDRQPLFSGNPFAAKRSRYSKPTKDPRRTLNDRESRRFYGDEVTALVTAAGEMWTIVITVWRALGLRPGELTHLRWLKDVIPLSDGRGYEIRLEGKRGTDSRCSCLQCKTAEGWAPKNGPRRYILDRTHDHLGWVTPAIEALDTWVTLRSPRRGDFIFPNPADHSRAWSNQKLNESLRELGREAGISIGQAETGGRTSHSWRHTCASELLEAGIPHPLAAWWIGDSLDEFMKTYGSPTDEAMAKVMFSRKAS
jgi:integrase